MTQHHGPREAGTRFIPPDSEHEGTQQEYQGHTGVMSRCRMWRGETDTETEISQSNDSRVQRFQRGSSNPAGKKPLAHSKSAWPVSCQPPPGVPAEALEVREFDLGGSRDQ